MSSITDNKIYPTASIAPNETESWKPETTLKDGAPTSAFETESTNQAKVDAYRQSLLSDGLLREIKPSLVDLDPETDFQPISVQGTPLSEVLIEERR